MRYRRLSYRYALVLSTSRGLPYGDPHPSELSGVRFAQTVWRPAADVCESEQSIEVTVELAGVDQDRIDVVVYEDAVIVEGNRHLRVTDADTVYQRAEIRQGPFRLELPLPGLVDQDDVDARYDNGLLAITFQKKATTR
jgi:HSP20 family protein